MTCWLAKAYDHSHRPLFKTLCKNSRESGTRWYKMVQALVAVLIVDSNNHTNRCKHQTRSSEGQSAFCGAQLSEISCTCFDAWRSKTSHDMLKIALRISRICQAQAFYAGQQDAAPRHRAAPDSQCSWFCQRLSKEKLPLQFESIWCNVYQEQAAVRKVGAMLQKLQSLDKLRPCTFVFKRIEES